MSEQTQEQAVKDMEAQIKAVVTPMVIDASNPKALDHRKVVAAVAAMKNIIKAMMDASIATLEKTKAEMEAKAKQADEMLKALKGG